MRGICKTGAGFHCQGEGTELKLQVWEGVSDLGGVVGARRRDGRAWKRPDSLQAPRKLAPCGSGVKPFPLIRGCSWP